MIPPEELLRRLDQIAEAVALSGSGMALIGLGSCGLELDRLDAYSDLDFFVIVQPGHKADFLRDLAWLSAPCPIAWAFRNTEDGYKALYEDGVFVEFAVFEPQEIRSIPFAAGRLVWAATGIDPGIADPGLPLPIRKQQPLEWQVGEILSNLYVGMSRYKRGEKKAAMQFVQGYAVDRLMELASQFEPEQPAFDDPFTQERRFEQRFPQMAEAAAGFLPGL
jgi:lincosamide nucleotidyltransferase B/F